MVQKKKTLLKLIKKDIFGATYLFRIQLRYDTKWTTLIGANYGTLMDIILTINLPFMSMESISLYLSPIITALEAALWKLWGITSVTAH